MRLTASSLAHNFFLYILKRKIKQGKENGNLDEVLLEITQKIQQKLKQHGWISIQLYKVKDFFSDVLIRLGFTSDNSAEKDLAYSIKKKLRKIERSLDY